MADPVTVSALGVLCWKALDLAWELIKGAGGNMVYDQAKQAVGLKDKWRNHHVPDAFAVAWRQAVKATRDEYFQQFPNHLGGSMEEAIREGTNALSRPEFIDGWLKQTAAAGGFDLAGNLAAHWEDQQPERANALTAAFRQHMPSMNPTLRHIPESFFQFWEGAFLHKLMYFFVEAAVKDDPKAWAQIQFNIHRSQCEMLAGIREDTAATRAMVGALGRLSASHYEAIRILGDEVSQLFKAAFPNRDNSDVEAERANATERARHLINQAMGEARAGNRDRAKALAKEASLVGSTDGTTMAIIGAFQSDQLQDLEAASETFRRGLDSDPTSLELLHHAVVHSARFDKGRRLEEALARIWPGFTRQAVEDVRIQLCLRQWAVCPSETPDALVAIIFKAVQVEGRRYPKFEWTAGAMSESASSHPDAPWLEKLRLVVRGEASIAELSQWRRWQTAQDAQSTAYTP